MTLSVALVFLATFRVTRFVVDDTFPPMRWTRDRVTAAAERSRVVNYLDELITCPWCVSIWIGAAAAVLADRWLTRGLAAPALVALSASAFTGVLATVLPD